MGLGRDAEGGEAEATGEGAGAPIRKAGREGGEVNEGVAEAEAGNVGIADNADGGLRVKGAVELVSIGKGIC